MMAEVGKVGEEPGPSGDELHDELFILTLAQHLFDLARESWDACPRMDYI